MTKYKFETIVCILVLDQDIELELGYNYTPGRPEQGPSYASGGEPEEPPEVEFGDVRFIDENQCRLDVPYWFVDLVSDTISLQLLEDHEGNSEDDRADYEYEKARDLDANKGVYS